VLLENRNAVIDGGGGPISGAVVRAFAREGARVFLAGRTRAKLDVVADEIRSAGGTAETAEVDALDEHAADEHADAVAAGAGSIDVSYLGHDQLDRRAALDDERGRRGNSRPPRKVDLERVVMQPRATSDAAAVAPDDRVAGAPRAHRARSASSASRNSASTPWGSTRSISLPKRGRTHQPLVSASGR
jgi:hypothetical protein